MGEGFARSANGALFAFCVVLYSLLFCAAAAAQTHVMPVVYVGAEGWQSDLIATCESGDGCEFALSACAPRVRQTLAFGESAIVENLRGLQCGTAPVGIAKLPVFKGYPRLSTYARRGGRDGVASIEIPSLEFAFAATVTPPASSGAILLGSVIQNDANFRTDLALFSDSDETSFATVNVIDEHNTVIATQTITLAPGFNFFPLTAEVRAGRIAIQSGTSGFGCPGCDTSAPLAGVALVNWRDGGSPRVVPLRAFFFISIP